MEIAPLDLGFGARVEIAALRQAYDEYHLLIFRDCGRIAPERQAEIVGWFGPIGANANERGEPWTLLSNSEPAGSQILPFHADISFMAHPIEGLSLHPVALPERDTSTTFVSNAVAWDLLPEEARRRIRGKTAEHLYDAPPDMQLGWPRLAHSHPACMTHERTGREFMFISEHHVSCIDGLPEDESDALLRLVFDTLYASKRRYEHFWRLGDLLIWDNLALQHARTEAAHASVGERTFQRVAIGTHNFPDQLEAVKRALAT
jgi:taurine dioxygenase